MSDSTPPTGSPASGPPPPQINPYKSESTTLILSIILGLLGLNGIGHLYVGKILLGILLLVGSIVVYYVVIIPFLFATILSFNFSAAAAGIIVALVAYIALFGWQIIHSRKLCQEYNAFYQANGRAPW